MMKGTYEALIAKAYDAFNARDIVAVLELMEADVKWPRAWEGDYVTGHEAVRAYWTQQWQEVNPIVTPVDFYETPDGRLGVVVRQLVKDKSDNVLLDGNVTHIYTFAEGKIKTMEIAKD